MNLKFFQEDKSHVKCSYHQKLKEGHGELWQ